MNSDRAYQIISLQSLHIWYGRLSEKSYFTRNLLHLMSITSVTGNTTELSFTFVHNIRRLHIEYFSQWRTEGTKHRTYQWAHWSQLF